MEPRYSIYFAGGLFSHKDLIGNRLLAGAIERQSAGRFTCLLPQHLELGQARAEQIRNGDLLALLQCDLALFNFDGAELDSGTVAEFMFAKMLDTPSVLLRTDFRKGGDQQQDAWNLMCSFYPRSRSLSLPAMDWYHRQLGPKALDAAALDTAYAALARPVIEAFEAVIAEPPVARPEGLSLEALYGWALRFPGAGLSEGLGEARLKGLLAEKTAKGLYRHPSRPAPGGG